MNMRLGLSLVLFGLALFGIPTHASLAAPASFGRPQHLVLSGDDWPNPSTWQQPVRHVAIGDINGDGRKDLAATYWIPEVPHYRLWIFLQRGDGTLAAPVDLPLATNTNIGGSVFTDLDGDGAQEVVVGSWLGPLIVVGMTEAGTFSVLAHGPEVGCKFMTTGDVDSDENSDIVCLDKEHTATVLYGNGSGGFRAASVEVQTLGGAVPSSSDTKSVHTADVTGDGHPDLLVTATFVGSFYVHPNDGNGGFLRAIAYKHPDVSNWYAAPAIVALDVDGDGANEVATLSPNVDRPNATLNLYKRGLDGRLFLWRRTPIQDRPHALIAGDVGGDGDVDLVSAHYLFNTATVFGEGTGSALPGQARYDLPGFGTVFADNSPEDFLRITPTPLRWGTSTATAATTLSQRLMRASPCSMDASPISTGRRRAISTATVSPTSYGCTSTTARITSPIYGCGAGREPLWDAAQSAPDSCAHPGDRRQWGTSMGMATPMSSGATARPGITT